jgi:hypothetical protein
MILINDLDYSFTEWRELSTLHGTNISKEDVSAHLEAARKLTCVTVMTGGMRIVENFFRQIIQLQLHKDLVLFDRLLFQ